MGMTDRRVLPRRCQSCLCRKSRVTGFTGDFPLRAYSYSARATRMAWAASLACTTTVEPSLDRTEYEVIHTLAVDESSLSENCFCSALLVGVNLVSIIVPIPTRRGDYCQMAT